MSGQQSFRTGSFEVSPDGTQFLAIVSEVVASRQPVTVVVNWIAEKAAGADGFAKPAKFD